MYMDNFLRSECTVLQPAQVVPEWPVIRELLAKAVVHGRGEVEVDDILELVLTRKMFVAVLKQEGRIVAAMAAELIPYPRKTVMNVAFLGGTLASEFDRNLPFLTAMAQVLKADAIRCSCRESVARYLSRHNAGFERAYVVLEKEVRP